MKCPLSGPLVINAVHNSKEEENRALKLMENGFFLIGSAFSNV
jgi:hypothetical protein